MKVESVLVVPVPSAGNVVGLVRWIFDPNARDAMPPHVTVLGPFLDPADIRVEHYTALSEAFASIPSFAYRLGRVDWFGDRVVYLAPEPAERFAYLTEAVVRLVPGHQPYGGAFDSVVPHVTLGVRGRVPLLEGAARLVATRLPIDGLAAEVLLMIHDRPGRPWHIERSFPLGLP